MNGCPPCGQMFRHRGSAKNIRLYVLLELGDNGPTHVAPKLAVLILLIADAQVGISSEATFVCTYHVMLGLLLFITCEPRISRLPRVP